MPFPTEVVKIIHNEGTDDEQVTEVDAHIQPESGFFNVDTPIYEGDVVEVADPRQGSGGRERRLAAELRVNSNAPDHMQHIQVKWGRATTRIAACVNSPSRICTPWCDQRPETCSRMATLSPPCKRRSSPSKCVSAT